MQRDSRLSRAERARQLRAHLQDVLPQRAQVRTDSLSDIPLLNKVNTSEGDVAHWANQARSTLGVNGAGIRIGVLSDGVDSLAARQATGDLPPTVTVLAGQAGSGDEGSAMLEIVHDLAPGADLFFATAFSGQASFAQNIRDLYAAGCDVIVDDVFYLAEPAFQDGIIAQAVNEVTADGALYFSAAGNSGNKNDGTSGVWEGNFVAAATTLLGDPVHDFGSGVRGNMITQDSPFLFTLQWSDAFGASGNDYDLLLMDAALTTIFDYSTNFQNGNGDPFEAIDSSFFYDTGLVLVVMQFSGVARYLHLNTHRGHLQINTAGQTSGHAAAAAAFSVAAVDVATASGGVFVGGATNPVEPYSSDGPRRIFYNADGTPITPGNFSSTGGTVRQKPDIAAADCVETATPGFNPFCGTSAAAPHAAAIAALILDADPSLIAAQVRAVLSATALDIEAPGMDRDSGQGILNALSAVQESIPLTLAITNMSKAEGNSSTTAFTFMVTLSAPSSGTVTVTYATANDSALAGSDYTATNGTLTFTPGQTSKTVTVNVTGDTTVEPTETFVVNLSGAVGANIADGQGSGTILNDDNTALRISDVSKAEGNASTTAFIFTVTLTNPSVNTVTVKYATANGSAVAGSDYTAVPATLLSFAPGQTSKTATVNVLGNTVVEPNETFTVNLSGAVGATIADGQGVGTIVNDDRPVLRITDDVSKVEGSSGTTAFTFTVTLAPASSGTVTVKYATANDTALAGSDYTATSGALTFTPGQTSKTITVPVKGDMVVESNEAFFVTLSGASGAQISLEADKGFGIILNDDGPVLRVTGVSKAESNSGTTAFIFTVALSPASTKTVTVHYATGDYSALAGSDYAATSGMLTFIPGQTSKTITVPVKGDLVVESNEAFIIYLSGEVGATIREGFVFGTIVNDDGPVLRINDVRKAEGNSGTTALTFTLTLVPVSPKIVTVQYATANSSALAGSDYTATSGTLTLTPGQTSKTVTVNVLGNTAVEPNEAFFVNLTSASGATLFDGQGLGTIMNDDGPVLRINDVRKAEGNSGTTALTFTLTLVPASPKTVTVKYATANGSALASSDYTATSGTLTLTPGQTSKQITVPVLGNRVREPTETFVVNLLSAGGATIFDGQGIGTILNDD